MYATPKLFKFEVFETKDEAKEFAKNWEGRQLGAISEGKGKFFITLPSDLSIAVEDSITEVAQLLKIKVEMGFEYMVGKNWYECH